MAYAAAADVADRWRTLTGPETSRVQVLLDDAEVWLDAWAPPTATPFTPHELQVRLVVSCGMVKRAMQAGDGPAITQGSETRGPFGVTYTYANPTGDLYLTRKEEQLLGLRRQRAGNVSLIGGE